MSYLRPLHINFVLWSMSNTTLKVIKWMIFLTTSASCLTTFTDGILYHNLPKLIWACIWLPVEEPNANLICLYVDYMENDSKQFFKAGLLMIRSYYMCKLNDHVLIITNIFNVFLLVIFSLPTHRHGASLICH